MAKLTSLGVMDDGAAYASDGKTVYQLVPGEGNAWRAAPIEPDRQVSIMSAYSSRGGKFAAPQEEAGTLENLGRGLAAGAANIPAMLGEVAGLKSISEPSHSAAESWRAGQSPDWKEAANTPLTVDGSLNPDLTVGQGVKKVAGTLAESAPQMLLPMGVGGKMAQGLIGLGAKPAVAGIVGGAVAEGGFGGLMNAGQISKMVDDAPEDKLVNSEAYQRAYHGLPADMDDTARRKQARAEVKSKAMQDVGWTTSVATAILGAPSGAALGRILGGETGRTVLQTMAKQGLLEAFQEAPQSAFEQRTQNLTVNKFIDPNQEANEGVLDAALMGIVSGVPMGGVMGGLAHQDGKQANTEPPVDDLNTQAVDPAYPNPVTPDTPPDSWQVSTPVSEASARAKEVRDALDRGEPVPTRESNRRGEIPTAGLSSTDQRIREERVAMGKAFDEFFRVVETKETDEGVGMFAASFGPEDDGLSAPEEAPLSALDQAAADLRGQIREPAPASNIDLTEEERAVTEIELAAAPAEQPLAPDGPANNIDVSSIEEIEGAPAPPGPPLALPAPTMVVDSAGNAQPQSQFDASQRAMEEQARALDLAGRPEEAIALRREAAGYQQELGDNAKAQASRAARIPQGLKDQRILRDFYRGHLQGMADELQAGATGYVTDEHGRITSRLPSANPKWFQNAGITVAQTRHAVKKALSGQPLGVREAQMVGGMLDLIHDRRTDRDVMNFARENRDQARRLRRDAVLGLPPIEAYENDGELFDEGAYHPDWDGNARALYELMRDAHAIDPVRTEQIADSARPDLDVARELLRIIHEPQQPSGTQEGAGRQEERLRPATQGQRQERATDEAASARSPEEVENPLTQAPLPESEEHLEAQVDAFLAGEKRGVLVSGKADDRPKTRLNVAVRKKQAVSRSVPQGTLYARPDEPLLHALDVALQGDRTEAIRSLVGQISLGISPDVAAANPADMDRIVQARNEQGGIITQVGATADTEQAATDQVSSQGATVETVPVEQGLSDRQQPLEGYTEADLADRRSAREG
jgi:hypothetical protein